jgi:hypothetical protein
MNSEPNQGKLIVQIKNSYATTLVVSRGLPRGIQNASASPRQAICWQAEKA